jgi:predicted nucleic acid-binding protein
LRLYPDASVLVPLLVDEDTSPAVQARFYGTDDELIVSDFAVAEVSSVISRYVRTGHQTFEEGCALLDRFDAWRVTGARSLATEAGDIDQATSLVRRFELMVRAPDALHLVLARRAGAALVTFDRQLGRAAYQIGLPLVAIRRN